MYPPSFAPLFGLDFRAKSVNIEQTLVQLLEHPSKRQHPNFITLAFGEPATVASLICPWRA